jgi:hypothetical protein
MKLEISPEGTFAVSRRCLADGSRLNEHDIIR